MEIAVMGSVFSGHETEFSPEGAYARRFADGTTSGLFTASTTTTCSS